MLKLEVPSRSVPQIIEILEMEGKAPVGFLKRSTLQDRLREEGYGTQNRKAILDDRMVKLVIEQELIGGNA